MFAFASDYLRSRWALIVFLTAVGATATTILTIWDVPIKLKYIACQFYPSTEPSR